MKTPKSKTLTYEELKPFFEKEIENEVITTSNFKSIGKCSNCSRRVQIEFNKNYCGNCGQRIKWGEYDDD